jgi:hypothetical protein
MTEMNLMCSSGEEIEMFFVGRFPEVLKDESESVPLMYSFSNSKSMGKNAVEFVTESMLRLAMNTGRNFTYGSDSAYEHRVDIWDPHHLVRNGDKGTTTSPRDRSLLGLERKRLRNEPDNVSLNNDSDRSLVVPKKKPDKIAYVSSKNGESLPYSTGSILELRDMVALGDLTTIQNKVQSFANATPNVYKRQRTARHGNASVRLTELGSTSGMRVVNESGKTLERLTISTKAIYECIDQLNALTRPPPERPATPPLNLDMQLWNNDGNILSTLNALAPPSSANSGEGAIISCCATGDIFTIPNSP